MVWPGILLRFRLCFSFGDFLNKHFLLYLSFGNFKILEKGKISSFKKVVFRNKFFIIIIYSWIEIMGFGSQYSPWEGFAPHKG